MNHHRPIARPTHAFTLIELLVVISIIALLIGILLPVLGSAREAARQSVCLGNMRSIGQAMATYAAESRDHLAGPNTSGWELTLTNSYPAGGNASTPVQNTDFYSPSFARGLGLPSDRAERMGEIFNNEFKCPSNGETYDFEFATSLLNPPSAYTVNSYSAVLAFHVFPSQNVSGSGNPIGVDSDAWSRIQPPSDYGPRLDLVKSGSSKFYAVEGSRFVSSSSGDISYNGLAKQIDGGNYMTYGPALASAFSGSPFKRSNADEIERSKRFAYRHQDSFNTVFFDGHGEALSAEDSLDITLYFPTGSTIVNAGGTDDPDDVNGVIP